MGGMSARFVLLRHDCPPEHPKPSHWDFMLESRGVLLTWQLNQLPADWSQSLGLPQSAESNSVAAIRLADHRLAYLEYEGAVSGNRGSVTRLDGGDFSWLQQGEDCLAACLQGSTLVGEVVLTQQKEAWALAFQPVQA